MNKCPDCGKDLNSSVRKTKGGGVPLVVVICDDCGVIVKREQSQSSSGAHIITEQPFTSKDFPETGV